MEPLVTTVTVSFQSKADHNANSLEAHFDFEFEGQRYLLSPGGGLTANFIHERMGLDAALSDLFMAFEGATITDLEAVMVLVVKEEAPAADTTGASPLAIPVKPD